MTPDELKSESYDYKSPIWRIVEDQWKAATVRITDTLDEQALLEEILDETKPVLPPETEGYDFLIATPFRYAPYPVGTRFRRSQQLEGAFYGSEMPETAIAEMAFYRLLFFKESPEAVLPKKPTEYTAFSAPIETTALIDLTEPPLNAEEKKWTDLANYTACQDLADIAREAGIEAIRSKSVRDPNGGMNITVLTLDAFADRQPNGKQTWYIYLRPQLIQAWCEHPKTECEYSLEWFAEDPRIR